MKSTHSSAKIHRRIQWLPFSFKLLTRHRPCMDNAVAEIGRATHSARQAWSTLVLEKKNIRDLGRLVRCAMRGTWCTLEVDFTQPLQMYFFEAVSFAFCPRLRLLIKNSLSASRLRRPGHPAKIIQPWPLRLCHLCRPLCVVLFFCIHVFWVVRNWTPYWHIQNKTKYIGFFVWRKQGKNRPGWPW